MKIGVGSLRKIQEPSYRFGFTYDIVNPGKWKVQQSKDQVSFTHELVDASDYSYLVYQQYQKPCKLEYNLPILTRTEKTI